MPALITLILRFRWTITYIFTILFINSLFMYLPAVRVLGALAEPADAVVGMIYVVRDFAQRELQHYILVAMIIAGILSYFFASKTVAVASICAFFTGEFIDWAIYTFTKKPLSQRIFRSAVISSPIDTAVFLYMMHMLNWADGIVVTASKLLGAVALWGIWRYKNRSSEYLYSIVNTANVQLRGQV